MKKVHLQWATVWVVCRFYNSFIYYKALKIDFVWSDMTITCKMVVMGVAGDHGDNPWKFLNHVIVQGTRIVLRPVKPIENGKRVMGFTLWYFFQKLNWISILSRISDWLFHSRSYGFIWLGPLRWEPLSLVWFCIIVDIWITLTSDDKFLDQFRTMRRDMKCVIQSVDKIFYNLKKCNI